MSARVDQGVTAWPTLVGSRPALAPLASLYDQFLPVTSTPTPSCLEAAQDSQSQNDGGCKGSPSPRPCSFPLPADCEGLLDRNCI